MDALTDRRQLIAVALPPGAEFVAATARIAAAGDAILPLPADLPAPALQTLLAQLRPAALIDGKGRTDLAAAVAVAAEVALVVATSGSTGAPKGVEHTDAALDASVTAGLDRIGARPSDVWLCCLPLHHVAGLLVLRRAAALGSTPIIHPRFDVATVKAVADAAHPVGADPADAPHPRPPSPPRTPRTRAATYVALVPTMLARLLDAGVDVARFAAILLGGAAASPALLARARDIGARVITTYGMTETAGGCVYDGVALDGVEVKLDGDDVISIRGPMLCAGYRAPTGPGPNPRKPATDPDGWFRTADLGRWDRDGRLIVLGRRDDVIVTGGENVAADTIADLLVRHPEIAEVAVSSRPDPNWGQVVVAIVVPTNPSAPPGLDELRAFVKARATAAHAPADIVIVTALPRLPSGKVARQKVAAIARRTGIDQ